MNDSRTEVDLRYRQNVPAFPATLRMPPSYLKLVRLSISLPANFSQSLQITIQS